MILHLKKDSVLLDKVNSKRFTWQAGQHSVQDELAKYLLGEYPELFEEVGGMDGVILEPQSQTPAPAPLQSAPQKIVCDVCAKEFDTTLALAGHKRTHNKPISTSDVISKQ